MSPGEIQPRADDEFLMEEKEEKLEFLKREEIKTMQKDIAALREVEAQKERERIAVIKTDAGKEKTEKPEPIKTALIPKPPKKQHPFIKTLTRMISFL